MTNKKFIAGSGISALIFSFYNPGYTIIAPNSGLGGKLQTDFLSKTIYIHEDEHSKQFLEDVGIEYKRRTHTIKYLKGGVVQREIYQIDKLSFIRKKMLDDKFEPMSLELSVSDYYINVLDVDFNLLIQKLKEKAKIIDETIIRITEDMVVTDKTSYEYEELVSTLPATIFNKLYYQSKNIEFKSLPVTFCLADEVPNVLHGVPFDLMYFIDNKYKYTRINAQNDKYLYEFSGKLTEEEVKKSLPNSAEILKYYVEETGIIFDNINNIPPPKIKFLGRFSQWNHKIKINDVIKESKWSHDFLHIWNLQTDFFNQVMGLNSIKTTEEKEKRTHIILLHIFSELNEILNETNYKSHKNHHEVNYDKIHEEIIDSFKFLLTLAIIWGMNVEKFVDKFYEKSKIVQDRFNKLKDSERREDFKKE